MTKKELILYLLRPNMDCYLREFKSGNDPYEVRGFAYKALDPMKEWSVISHNEEEMETRMEVQWPKNPYFDECEQDHTFVLFITIKFGSYEDDTMDRITRISKVVVDGEEFSFEELGEKADYLLYFADNRMIDGWAPVISDTINE